MKKLKKSIKAIIISLCLVVVLAGSAVGVILSRDKNGAGNPDKGSSKPAYQLSEDQKSLFESINKNLNSEIKIADVFDRDSYVDENGDEIDMSLVVEDAGEYLEIKDDIGTSVMLQQNKDGEIYYIDAFKLLNITNNVLYRQYFEYEGGYIAYIFAYEFESSINVSLSVYDVSNVSEIKKADEVIYENVGSDFINHFSFEYSEVNIESGVCYVQYPQDNFGNVSFKFNVFPLNNFENIKTYVVSQDDYDFVQMSKNSYVFVCEDVYYFGYLKNDNIVEYSFELENVSNLYLCEDKVFVEVETTLENTTYSYYLIDLATGVQKQFEIDADYARAVFDYSSTNYYEMYEYKVDENGNQTIGRFVYLDKNLNRVVVYDANSISDKVVYSKGTNILTNSGVLTFKNSINAEYIIKFDESNNLKYMSDYGVNQDTFIVFDEEKSIFKIMNIDGEFVYEDNFYSIVSYENGYYFARTQSSNYVLNVNNQTMKKVSNYASNNSLIYVGGGYYFTSYMIGDNTLFKMFDYSGKLIHEDIKSLNYYLENKFTLLDIAFENETITYDVTGFVNLAGQTPVSDTIDREISLYGDGSKTSNGCTVSFDGEQGDDESDFTVTITMKEYYALSSSGTSITLDRNATNDDIVITAYTTYDSSSGTVNYGYHATYVDSGSCDISMGKSGNSYVYTITGSGSGSKNVDNLLSASVSKSKVQYRVLATVNGTTTTYVANTGESVTIPTPTKYGHTFSGWSGNASGTSCTITKSPYFFTKYEITANFKANKYTISYSLNDSHTAGTAKKGTYAPTSKSYAAEGGANDFNISHPSLVGYSFSSWSISGMDDTTHWWGNSSTTATSATGVTATTGYLNLRRSSGTVTFTAYWTVNTYTIKLVRNNGSSDSTYTKNYDAEFSVTSPTKLGYTFTGWNLSNMSTNCTHYWGGSSHGTSSTASNVTAASNYKNLRSTSGTVTFTATWQANTYSIKYVLGNGKQVSGGNYPTSLSYDSTYNISAPVCMGYTFAGWSISGMSTNCTHYWGGSGRGTNASASSVTATSGYKNLRSESGEVTFTATWSARSYTITYDMQNPNAVTNDISSYANVTTYYDTLEFISHPSKVGYIFAGWTVSGMDDKNFETDETVTHYHGASATALESFTGTDIGTPTFDNYYKNLHSGSGTVTFHANWTPITYSLTYNANGGAFDSDVNNTPTATYDVEFSVISPRKHGYDFIGWEITNTVGTTERETTVLYPGRGTESFINLTTVNNSTVTLKAKWHETYYNIHLSFNNPTIADETVIAWYDVEVTIENPVRMGYIFDYWTITGCSDCSESGRPDFVDVHYYGETTADTAISGTNLAGEFTCTKFKNLHCTAGSTVTFTAHWIQKTYKVMNHAAGYYNPVIATEYTVKFDEVFSFAVPENSPFGYHFGGWTIENCNENDEDTGEIVPHYRGADSSVSNVFEGTTDSVDLDGNEITYYFMNLSSNQDAVVNITPIWRPNEYYITFDMNNPNIITTDISTFADVTAYYDNYYELLWIDYPTKAGYTFLGWSISNMTDDCTHYYDIDETWVANEPFESANGKYTDPNNPNIYIFMKNHAFKNLRSDHLSSTKVVFTANWQAIKYTITYHFLPTNFDVTAYLISELNTKVNKVSQMIQTQTVTVTYDKLYEALNYRYEIDPYIFADTPDDERKINYDLPIGMKLKAWGISASVKSSATITGKSDGAGSVMSAFSDYILPNQQRMYGPGTEGDVDDINWAYYSSNIHLYACYDLAGITLKYYAPTSATYKNKMGSIGETYADLYYKCVDSLTTTIKYTESVTFANNPGINSDLVGWMISADYFSSGDLTIESLTTYLYNGTTYYTAYAGATALWNFTNVDAYSYDDPTYFLYAVYSEPHSGSFDVLDFTYHSDTNSFGVALNGSAYSYSGLKIPSYYYHGESQKFLPVTHVENYGFYDLYSFDFEDGAIVLPDTITHIGNYAFRWAWSSSSIFSVQLSKNLVSIGSYAFDGCYQLSSIYFPASLKTIGGCAFSGCYSITSVIFNEGLETIGNNAFYGCTSLTGAVVLPSTLTTIGSSAFCNNEYLESINIPKGVTRLESYTFNMCTSLTSITFDCENVSGTNKDDDSSLVYIGDYCFDSCISLTSINIPNTVTYIGLYAFAGNESLSNIELPEKLTYLGENAFWGCYNLQSIKIPVGVTVINACTFTYCESLQTVELHDKITRICQYAFEYCSSLTELEIPKSVTYFGIGIFEGCSALERLVVPFLGENRDDSSYNCLGYLFGAHDYYDTGYVPDSLKYVEVTDATRIGEGAFFNCSSIEEIVISDTVQYIYSGILEGCTMLKRLTIPFVGGPTRQCNSFGKLLDLYFIDSGEYFEFEAALTTLKVTSAEYIEDFAFENLCQDWTTGDEFSPFENLTSIEINEGVTSIGNAAFYNTRITSFKFPKSLRAIRSSAFKSSDLSGDLGLNEGLKSIGAYAFQSCSGLTKVVIPSTVHTIDNQAFIFCHGLETLDINMAKVTSLGYYIFAYCSALKSIVFPQSFTYVPGYMFYACKKLSSVTLHEGLTEIRSYAFYNTESLKNINLPSTVEIINSYAFAESRLTSLVCPESLYFIGESAFYECYSLVNVKFNEGLEEIGSYAFQYGFNGDRLEIPRSVLEIGESAFYNDYWYIDNLIIHSTTSISEGAFYCVLNDGVTIYYGGTPDDFYDGNGNLFYNDLEDNGLSYNVVFDYDHMVFTYHAETDTYSIGGTSKYGTINNYVSGGGGHTFVIPSTYDDGVHGRKNVTKIDDYAFDCEDLGKISIPSTITHIGNHAFEGNLDLTDGNGVRLPSGLTYIGDYAFSECMDLILNTLDEDGLQILPSGLTYIGSYAFRGCEYLTSNIDYNAEYVRPFTIPAGVTRINEQAFADVGLGNADYSLQINILGNVEVIGSNAFYNFGGYRKELKIDLPNSVKHIEDHAFYGTTIASIDLHEGIETIGYNAFAWCTKLKQVSLPSTLSVLNSRVFWNCTSLSTVFIPSTVEVINASAWNMMPFYNCNYEKLMIFCEDNGRQSGWGQYWNYIDSSTEAKTFFDYPMMPNVVVGTYGGSHDGLYTHHFYQTEENLIETNISSTKSGKDNVLIFQATGFVNIRFEYALLSQYPDENYNTASYFGIYINPSGKSNSEPVARITGSTAYQYYSRMLGPGDMIILVHGVTESCWTSNSWKTEKAYIKNLAFDPITYDKMVHGVNYVDFNSGDQNYSKHLIQFGIWYKPNQTAWFEYHAIDYVNVSFVYYSSSERYCDYLEIFLNNNLIVSCYDNVMTYNNFSQSLKPGDVLRLTYKKDGSVDEGYDAAYIYNFFVSKPRTTDQGAELGQFRKVDAWTNVIVYTEGGTEMLRKTLIANKPNTQITMQIKTNTELTPLTPSLTYHQGIWFLVAPATASGTLDSSFDLNVESYRNLLTTLGQIPSLGASQVASVTLTIPRPGVYFLYLYMGSLYDGKEYNFDVMCTYNDGASSIEDATFSHWLTPQYDPGTWDAWDEDYYYYKYYTTTNVFGTYNNLNYYHGTNDTESGSVGFGGEFGGNNGITDIIQSQNKGDAYKNTSSWYRVIAPYDSVLSFDYIVSSQRGYDLFSIWVNGELYGRYSGVTETTDCKQTGHYDIAVERNDIVEFRYQKNGSTNSGKDNVYVYNIEFKEEFIFKREYNSTQKKNFFTSTNNGVQDSESVYFIRPELCYYDYALAKGIQATSAYIYIDYEISSESINDRFEVWSSSGERLYRSYNSATGRFEYFCNTFGEYLIVKYVKDGSYDAGDDECKFSYEVCYNYYMNSGKTFHVDRLGTKYGHMGYQYTATEDVEIKITHYEVTYNYGDAKIYLNDVLVASANGYYSSSSSSSYFVYSLNLSAGDKLRIVYQKTTTSSTSAQVYFRVQPVYHGFRHVPYDNYGYIYLYPSTSTSSSSATYSYIIENPYYQSGINVETDFYIFVNDEIGDYNTHLQVIGLDENEEYYSTIFEHYVSSYEEADYVYSIDEAIKYIEFIIITDYYVEPEYYSLYIYYNFDY